MSLLKKIGKFAKKAIRAVAPIASILPVTAPFAIAAQVAGAVAGGRPAARPGGSPFDLVSMAMPQAYAQPLPRQLPVPIPRTTPPVTIPRTGGGRITPAPGSNRDSMGRLLKRTAIGWLPRVGRAAASAAGWVAIGAYWLDAAGNIVGVRTSRRMNPLNHRALRRAISRVKGATKICREVERITAPRRRGGRSSGRGSARAEAACR